MFVLKPVLNPGLILFNQPWQTGRMMMNPVYNVIINLTFNPVLFKPYAFVLTQLLPFASRSKSICGVI